MSPELESVAEDFSPSFLRDVERFFEWRKSRILMAEIFKFQSLVRDSRFREKSSFQRGPIRYETFAKQA